MSNNLSLVDTVITNYSPNRGDLIGVESIFSKELEQISTQVNKKIKVSGSWVERAEKGMYHPVHNHGLIGLSAICYVEFDCKSHEPVIFVSPFTNPFNGQLILAESSEMKEGVILVFPSFIQHYTNPNKSNKIRTTLSFNLETF